MCGRFTLTSENKEIREHFSAIITTSANEFMRPVHDRMPVIIEKNMYHEWLETGDERLLLPYSGKMDCYPVSKSVNNPKNNDKELIEPLR